MFCSNCGNKIKKGAQFCQNCGNDIRADSRKKLHVTSSNLTISDKKISEDLFYSEDWSRTKVFVIATIPHFDILIDEEYLYLIRFPISHSGALGSFLGFMLFSIIGAVIGAIIGNSSDRKKRKKYRSVWVNSNHDLVSGEYEKYIFLKIPISQLGDSLVLKKTNLLCSLIKTKISL